MNANDGSTWLSLVADVVGIAAFVAAIVGFVIGRRELRRQAAAVNAARKAVEDAMVDLRGRYLASQVAEARSTVADFARSCRTKEWQRAVFVGDNLRAVLVRMLSIGGFGETDLSKLRLALDEVKVVHDKVRRSQPGLTQQNLAALDSIQETLDHMYGRRAVPALAVGDPQ